MTKREDLRLQGDTGSKTGGDQGEKGNKKRAHRDTTRITNARNHCIFSLDGVFGNHRHSDPHKIGVLGFSAGGYLVAEISTHFDHRLYAPVDAPDRESCRPDFAVAIYPGHLWTEDNLELNPL